MKTFFRQNLIQNKDTECILLGITTDSRKAALLADINKTQSALEIAYAGFDNAVDPDLIDCYVYEINSVLKRYRFLLNQAARLNLLPETYSLDEVPSLLL